MSKEIYDKFGSKYQETRDSKDPKRAFNDLLELPCMLQAVGEVSDRKLLDVGCGAGVHAKEYARRGATVSGIDQSETMIGLAKQMVPYVEFEVADVHNLPFEDGVFDVVTGSLVYDYIEDLEGAFNEVARVLGEGGLFCYSDNSIVDQSREYFENDFFRGRLTGYLVDKKNEKRYSLGSFWDEGVVEWEMDSVAGMEIRTYKREIGTHIRAIAKAGFQVVDIIGCRPGEDFKERNPKDYALYSRFPIFFIYKCKKII